MAKAETSEVVEKPEGSDAPLLDLNEAAVRKMIARGKKRGYITYDELNEALPQGETSSELIEDVTAQLSDMGINIVENEEAGEDDEGKEPDEDEEPGEDDGEGKPKTVKKPTAKRRS